MRSGGSSRSGPGNPVGTTGTYCRVKSFSEYILTVVGSKLQLQLKSEGLVPTQGALFEKGLLLLEHVRDKPTPGCAHSVIWKAESSICQHEYILISITSEEPNVYSWMRIERMKGSRSDSSDTRSADLSVALATSENLLSCGTDTVIKRIDFDQEGPSLVDVANVYLFLHQEASCYTALAFNCWWLSREFFRSLVSAYMPDNTATRQLLHCCRMREVNHCTASFHSSGRGRLLRMGFLVATLPIFFITYPVIIVGSGVVAYTISHDLKKVRREMDVRMRAYTGAPIVVFD